MNYDDNSFDTLLTPLTIPAKPVRMNGILQQLLTNIDRGDRNDGNRSLRLLFEQTITFVTTDTHHHFVKRTRLCLISHNIKHHSAHQKGRMRVQLHDNLDLLALNGEHVHLSYV